ncbi:hypothetical protein FQR65_LT15197 [Abscondita terminalis]|nr:hypothetical protein FQR65_LT15197 [Abscondita terminalis]
MRFHRSSGFSHFSITMMAIDLGKQRVVEKPSGQNFLGSRINACKKAARFNKPGKEAGIIKDVTAITARYECSETLAYLGIPNIQIVSPKEPTPATLDWELLADGTQGHDFNKDFCQTGNARIAGLHFGIGALETGAHILDTAHEFLDLGLPFMRGKGTGNGWELPEVPQSPSNHSLILYAVVREERQDPPSTLQVLKSGSFCLGVLAPEIRVQNLM